MANKQKRDWLAPPEWWRRFKPLRWLVIGLLGFGVYSWLGLGQKAVEALQEPHRESAAFTATASQPVALIEPFNSYASVAEVEQELARQELAWSTQILRTAATPEHPARNLDTLSINEYSHQGRAGKLTLEFFNDRLYEAVFVPANPGSYAAVVHGMGLKPQLKDNGRAERIRGHQRMASNVDLAATEVGQKIGTVPRMIWQDLRLIKQRDDWDTRFGTLAAE